MPLEAIVPLSQRNNDPLERLNSATAQNPGAEQLIERYEHAARGEGTREEDSRPDHRGAQQHAGRPAPVAYPPAGPSLPPPLVPIRKVPLPDAALTPNEIPEAVQERLGVEKESPDTVEHLEAKRDAQQLGHDEADRGTQAEPAPEQATAAPEERQRDFSTEQTLQRVVLSQTSEGQPAQANHDDAGRFVDTAV